MTSNLEQRVYEHKTALAARFTAKYNAKHLVYFEATSDVHAALAREKQLKRWTRARKVALVRAINPLWQDLARDWYDKEDSSSPPAPQNDISR